MWVRNLSTTVFFLIVQIKFSNLWTTWPIWQGLFRALPNISDEASCETIFAVNYFCKMLYLRCLTGFWICLCLRLRSLKFYLFSRNTNYVIKSRLPYQFWKLFTVVIRTRSCGSTIAMPIIFDNHNTINSWGSQERAF